MRKGSHLPATQGPFRAEYLRSGDPYELSHGHAIFCEPAVGRGAKAAQVGGEVLASDPLVEDVGFDTGYSPTPDTLRAPDLSVGKIPDEPGWVQGAPLLAVEYADTGQDEAQLEAKVDDLLAAGTRFVWIVRLTGPRRVEVHQMGAATRLARPGELLEAPGILANPVPVEALYDPEVGRRVTLKNLLQREGYESLEAVREEGEVRALSASILAIFAARGLTVGEELQTAVESCRDPQTLRRWQLRAVTAETADEALSGTGDGR